MLQLHQRFMKFSTTNLQKFFAELFRKSTVIFPEISGKIPQEISGNFRTANPTRSYEAGFRKGQKGRSVDSTGAGFLHTGFPSTRLILIYID